MSLISSRNCVLYSMQKAFWQLLSHFEGATARYQFRGKSWPAQMSLQKDLDICWEGAEVVFQVIIAPSILKEIVLFCSVDTKRE